MTATRTGGPTRHDDAPPHPADVRAAPRRVVHRPPPPPRRSDRTRRLAGSPAARAFATAVALTGAVVVLVVARVPSGGVGPDAVAATVDGGITRTVHAELALSVLSWLGYVSTALVLGGVAFWTIMGDAAGRGEGRRSGAERLVQRLAVLGIAAGVASIGVRAVALGAGGAGALRHLHLAGDVLSGPLGDAVLLRTVGLALVACALTGHLRPGPVLPVPTDGARRGTVRFDGTLAEHGLCLLGSTLVLASFALVGHPQASEPRALLIVVQLVHVTAAATWFGGITVLALGLRRTPSSGVHVPAAVIRRFSHVALVAAVATTVSGTVLAASQIAALGELLRPYGRTLVLKTAVVALVLTLGAHNHRSVVPAVSLLRRAPAWSRLRRDLGRLQRTCTAEALLIAFGVLVLTAAMTSGGL